MNTFEVGRHAQEPAFVMIRGFGKFLREEKDGLIESVIPDFRKVRDVPECTCGA